MTDSTNPDKPAIDPVELVFLHAGAAIDRVARSHAVIDEAIAVTTKILTSAKKVAPDDVAVNAFKILEASMAMLCVQLAKDKSGNGDAGLLAVLVEGAAALLIQFRALESEGEKAKADV